uniref:Uncharacterized protein n=1 Tax=Arundo donax TaxID=35708 RepID=A0A0A9D6S5_ARUDO
MHSITGSITYGSTMNCYTEVYTSSCSHYRANKHNSLSASPTSRLCAVSR